MVTSFLDSTIQIIIRNMPLLIITTFGIYTNISIDKYFLISIGRQ